jgi:ribosomal protein S11
VTGLLDFYILLFSFYNKKMSNIVINNLNINSFLKNIKSNKNFVTKLKSQQVEINSNHDHTRFKNSVFSVAYIVYVVQNKTSLAMHITNSEGNLIYSATPHSAGFSGKAKQRAQASIVKKFLSVLLTSNQVAFLKSKPIALHLTNIGFIKQWLIKKLKKTFFIESVRIFTTVPFNGCRKKKLRRKKIKKKS